MMDEKDVVAKQWEARKTAMEMCNRYLQNYFVDARTYDPVKVKNVFQLLNYVNGNCAFTYEEWNLISSTVGWDFAFDVIMKHTWTQSYRELYEKASEPESFIPTSNDIKDLYCSEEDEMPHAEIYLIIIEYISNQVA